jgi:DNA polymerase-1
MSYQYEWTHKRIENLSDVWAMARQFRSSNPTAGGFDTETTGLHIINDKPFMFQFGFLDDASRKGYAYTIDLESSDSQTRMTVLGLWTKDLAPELELYMAHNITYDLHMMQNIGYPYRTENMLDTQALIRYSADSVQVEYGGAPMGLKDFSKRFIDASAADHERKLKSQKTAMLNRWNTQLRDRFYGEVDRDGRLAINAILGKPTFEPEDLPRFMQPIYEEWLGSLPEQVRKKVVGYVGPNDIPYNLLDRETLAGYAGYDIQLLLETYIKCKPVTIARENWDAVMLEMKMVLPCFDMERIGLKIDTEYLRESKQRMREYIRLLYDKLWLMLGEPITTGQHKRFREIALRKWGVDLPSTAKAELNMIKHTLPEGLQKAIECLEELRTLDKWYAVYLLRYERDLQGQDKIYTQLNSTGTVSGRFSSDFQQFPKYAVSDAEGNELFHPRRMITTEPDKGFGTYAFIDYSQIELRLQAMYTILCEDPDLNLCRAYMPYKCIHAELGEFDCGNMEHLRRWDEDWRLCESTDTKWEPTDIHGETAKLAFNITPDDPNWKLLRSEAKRINFAKQYGATRKMVATMFPEYSDSEITKIDNAYYNAFPGVKTYHNYCYEKSRQSAWVSNLFGVKYWNASGHKLINLLVQGSAAFLLKKAIRDIWEYLQNNPNIRTQMVISIHDEIMFRKHDMDPDSVLLEFRRIMQDYEDSLVPIVAEIDVTDTTWANKKPYKED